MNGCQLNGFHVGYGGEQPRKEVVMTEISMKQMLEAGVHFGHQTSYWNPEMKPYIYGDLNRIHIINLEKTQPLLKDAANFVGKVASNGGKILFVGTKRAASLNIQEEAKKCGMPYVSHRWLGGMLTNFNTVRQSIKRLKDIEEMFEDGSADKLSKKEALIITREYRKLDRSLGGIRDMNMLPDAIFIIDVGYERIAVKEAVKLGIPVIAVVDTNNSIDGIDYIIPGNDDAIRAIHIYASTLADAIKTGASLYKEKTPEKKASSSKKAEKSPKRAVKDEIPIRKKKKIHKILEQQAGDLLKGVKKKTETPAVDASTDKKEVPKEILATKEIQINQPEQKDTALPESVTTPTAGTESEAQATPKKKAAPKKKATPKKKAAPKKKATSKK